MRSHGQSPVGLAEPRQSECRTYSGELSFPGNLSLPESVALYTSDAACSETRQAFAAGVHECRRVSVLALGSTLRKPDIASEETIMLDVEYHPDEALDQLGVDYFSDWVMKAIDQAMLVYVLVFPTFPQHARSRRRRDSCAGLRELACMQVLGDLLSPLVQYPAVRALVGMPSASLAWDEQYPIPWVVCGAGWEMCHTSACRIGGSHHVKYKLAALRFDVHPLQGCCPGSNLCVNQNNTGTWPDRLNRRIGELVSSDLRRHLELDAALSNVRFTPSGRVQRHVLRGTAPADPKELKREEDRQSLAGMRDPADLLDAWPQLWHGMAGVTAALMEVRESSPELRGLWKCFGDKPARSAPSETAVQSARCAIARAIRVSPADAERHHPHSPWRHEIVRALQQCTGDPDRDLADWLRDGVPMGLSVPLRPGGLFPRQESTRTVDPESLSGDSDVRNHPSFRLLGNDGAPVGAAQLGEYLNQGFGTLYRSKADADTHLGVDTVPSPLGNIRKIKQTSEVKDRIVQDMTSSQVNAACDVRERQVLPTYMSHARDVALMSRWAHMKGDSTAVAKIDFEGAFMSLALADAERRYNACSAESDLHRTRPPHFPDEVVTGRYIVWNVIGFGGRPNPVAFARAASFAARCGQALFRGKPGTLGEQRAAHVRLQVYVDDPVMTFGGKKQQIELAIDLLFILWLVVGIPIAWRKGAISWGEQYEWIGAKFHAVRPGVSEVSLPPEFIADLHDRLEPLAKGEGVVSQMNIDTILGKAGRVSYLIPDARPFVASLWGALAGCVDAETNKRREAPPGCRPCSRFAHGARWLRALLQPGPSGKIFPLSHCISDEPAHFAGLDTVTFDASPWGGGAVLFRVGRPVAWCRVQWCQAEEKVFKARIGESAFQSLWEFIMLLHVLVAWADDFIEDGLDVAGDNISSLEAGINLSGKGPLHIVAKEISWRRVRGRWKYRVGHLPTEANGLSDALSRLSAPTENGKCFPQDLSDIPEHKLVPTEDLWHCSRHLHH